MLGTHVVYNGKVVDVAAAVVPVTNREVQYGFCTYESLRVLGGKVVHLDDHLARLKASCDGIHLAHPFTSGEIGSWVFRLIDADGLQDATMKILMYGGPEPRCFVIASPLLAYPDSFYTNGVGVITYHGERLLPNCKTGNLLLNYMAVEEAKRQGCFEAVLIDREEEALEGTRSNFYAFRSGTLYTAPDEKVLLGVTRSRVLKAAAQLHIPVVFQAPKEADLLSGLYDECFISATSMAAMPIARIGSVKLPPSHQRTLSICKMVRTWELDDRN
ncbi:MAG: aminotransferase class IV [Sphaerochaeta sp.]|jgi:branched-subunit amino acid aminotransferase/4-amino-4-deoxychorismate lyase|nr:aminotransferase class IV [Sphaerochaeta sp.]MCH3921133.1 aminotransferase class IV [Sphaerochaeta sp.]MCH3921137.1 aminotransferase class IV [Sphaerochaeta sp.]MCI2076876.1 aminotransferase class IV [Sphaerochaeta sp.]MCI2097729.1 aminotransferase class IV [Sphaerochaeta sp.]